MLIQCIECGNLISNSATSCPHCGYTIQNSPSKLPRSKNKRMKLPNGFGQITEIKDRRLRNRYRVMITVGKNNMENLYVNF